MGLKTNLTSLIRENMFSLAGLVFRLAFLFISDYVDRMGLRGKYTDLDYFVVTDGSRYILEGGSPFDRHTYRYTPLLAYMTIPCITTWFGFGKFIYVLSDILTAFYMRKILRLTSTLHQSQIDMCLALWIFNPIGLICSTRGSADTLIGFMTVVTMYELLKGRVFSAGLVFGFAVHFKIYPLLYALPMYFYIDRHTSALFTRKRLIFFFTSAGLFIALFALFYYLYGWTFAYETYFYHLIRKDNRHNFSLSFYYMYLNFEGVSVWQSVLAFVPQLILLGVSGWKYYRDLPFCVFVQTFFFVMYNKVCTAQYFIWYSVLFPLVFAKNELALKARNWWKMILIFIIWLVIVNAWNYFAFRLETEGQNAFYEIFLVCIVFFLLNFGIIYGIIKNQHTEEFRIVKQERSSL